MKMSPQQFMEVCKRLETSNIRITHSHFIETIQKQSYGIVNEETGVRFLALFEGDELTEMIQVASNDETTWIA